MNKLKVEYININNIKPYEKNARKHDKEQINYIANSIKKFGMADPIGIWGKDNLIIEGHGRLLALKKLGYKEVPCIRLDYLTDEERKAYTLAHNKVSEFAEWDFDLLGEELDNIFDIDMQDFGFNFEETDEEEKEIERNDLSNKEFEKYEIIIVCKDELELEKNYDKLTEEGYECRISTL